MSKRIESIPELDNFVFHINRILSDDYPNSFWNCKDLFETLVSSEFVTHLVNYELSRLVEEPLYTLRDATETNILLVDSDFFRLGLSILENTNLVIKKQKLYSLTSHQMIGIHGNGKFDIEYFHQPSPYPIEVLDKNKPLTAKGHVEVSSQRATCFRAFEDVINIIPPQETCLAFSLVTNDLGSIRWEYDSDTLLPTRAIATDIVGSRIQYAANTLVELECEEAIPSLKSLCDHPDHFVRWSSISNLIQLDYEAGIAMINRALDDKHPHVRNAARQSLNMLESNSVQS